MSDERDIFSIYKEHPHVCAGVSERSDGSMVWWNTLPVDETIKKNRDSYFERKGVDPARVVSGGLMHGTTVAAAEEKDAAAYLLNTDALVTNTPNLFLSITGADCMPILYYDPVQRAVGIAHAGWRGLVAGLAERLVREMTRRYDSLPEDIIVSYGPHIGVCHFEVGEDVAAQFDHANIEIREGYTFASLAKEATMRLARIGVHTTLNEVPCTYCFSERFYSARRDKETPLKGMLAYIGLRG